MSERGQQASEFRAKVALAAVNGEETATESATRRARIFLLLAQD
ncbi:hypothetical protein [Rhodobacter sp. 24-YEA-8]|nr:hypothetical protein [Rhodobacter sp. 24-YEA-8]